MRESDAALLREILTARYPASVIDVEAEPDGARVVIAEAGQSAQYLSLADGGAILRTLLGVPLW